MIEFLQLRINEAFKHARSLRFELRPTYSLSPARTCVVSISNEAMEVRIKGAFMADMEHVASLVCRLSGFAAPMKCRLEKTFAKPLTKLMTFDQAGQATSEGQVIS